MHLSAPPAPPRQRTAAWDRLAAVPLPTRRGLRVGLPAVSAPDGAASQRFDVLRTRALAVLEEHGWTRLGITQPRNRPAACYAAVNLGLSLARRPSLDVLVVDLDLRTPRLAAMLGLERAAELGPALRAEAELLPATRRIGPNLAVLCNAVSDPLSGETLQEPGAARSLARLVAALAPSAVVLVLPPMLEGDAGLAGLALADTLLMVADGKDTVAADIRACGRLAEGGPPVLGLALVEAEG